MRAQHKEPREEVLPDPRRPERRFQLLVHALRRLGGDMEARPSQMFLRTIASKRRRLPAGAALELLVPDSRSREMLGDARLDALHEPFLVGVYCQSASKRESDCNTVAASAAPLTSNCLASRARAASSAALMTTASATGSPGFSPWPIDLVRAEG